MEAEIRGFFTARKIVVWLGVIGILLGSMGTAWAQSTASLNGTVTDTSGAVVPNARVSVTNQGTGVVSVSQTDASGAYLFPSLPIGVYRIEVTAPSFQSAVIGKDRKSVV